LELLPALVKTSLCRRPSWTNWPPVGPWDEPGYFEKASIDPETWTVCWPNGEDVAPDAMYEEVKKQQGEGA
jgi:hypothetical protein